MQNVPAVDSTASDLLGAAHASERTRCATGLLAWPEEPHVDRLPTARQRLLRGDTVEKLRNWSDTPTLSLPSKSALV